MSQSTQVKLKEVFRLTSGARKPEDHSPEATDTQMNPVYGGNGVTGYTAEELVDGTSIVIGRVGEKCGNVHIVDGKHWITDNALYTKWISEDANTKYLYYVLNYLELNRLRKKGGQPLISQKPIYDLSIPLPPLPEQKRIATILSTWDRAIELTDRLIEACERRKRGLMEGLLTGRFADEENLAYWKRMSLGDICEINPPKPKDVHETSMVSFITMSDVSESAELESMVDKEYSEVSKGYTAFQDGDVLVAKITPCFENGKGARAEGLTNGVGFGSTEFHVLRAKDEIDPRFIHYHTTTRRFRGIGGSRMTGSAGQKRVPKSFLQSYSLLLPPLQEQILTVRILQLCDNEIHQWREYSSLLINEKNGLLQELLCATPATAHQTEPQPHTSQTLPTHLMTNNPETPRAFISYCWSSEEHKAWTLELASRLTHDGVETTIDRWHLKEGQDANHFMESMVRSDEFDRVLIILDKAYSERANNRFGGVGIESQIISPEIYNSVKQEKFIPIIAERNSEGEPYIPTFLKGRVYIDLSNTGTYEDEYEKLLRNIFKLPETASPKLGTPPAHLFEESADLSKTDSIMRGFDAQIAKNPSRIDLLSKRALDSILDSLREFEIIPPESDMVVFGQKVHDSITQYTPVRDSYVSLLSKLSDHPDEFDIDPIVRFLEGVVDSTQPDLGTSQWNQISYDFFRFSCHELFLYTIAIFLKGNNFSILEHLLQTRYIFNDWLDRDQPHQDFSAFHRAIASLSPFLNKVDQKNYTNSMAEMITRRIPSPLSIHDITEADLFCHYVGLMHDVDWFPITYIYARSSKVEAFSRLVSRRHFEKTKGIFDVDTVDELKDLVQRASGKETPRRYPLSHQRLANISSVIDINTLGTAR